jgi:hypothetical protein
MELEQISDGPIGLGTRIRRRNRHFGEPIEGEMEIIEWEPERAMGAQIHDANAETRGRVTFEALGPSRTRLTIRGRLPEPRFVEGRPAPPIDRADRQERASTHGVRPRSRGRIRAGVGRSGGRAKPARSQTLGPQRRTRRCRFLKASPVLTQSPREPPSGPCSGPRNAPVDYSRVLGRLHRSVGGGRP